MSHPMQHCYPYPISRGDIAVNPATWTDERTSCLPAGGPAWSGAFGLPSDSMIESLNR